jgi:hypothetical protein
VAAELSTKPVETGEFPVTVSREIVSHLSFALYKNFARAIRELISNAYDAGAEEVRIGLDLESSQPKVIVRDTGSGMNKDDLDKRLFRLGNVTLFTDKIDEYGRKRVGQFGIGFLSTFPYCDRVTVTSKKAGTEYITEVIADTGQFFEGETFNIGDYRVRYSIYNSDIAKKRGETIITLEGIKPHIVRELRRSRARNKKSSIERFEGYEKFRWTLQQFAPIEFPAERGDLRELFNYQGRKPIRLWLDGDELFRNVPEGAEILQSGREVFDGIEVKYAIMTPNEPVKPEEARGLQVRVCDVGIGLPTDFDVVKLRGRVLGKLNYLCGEVHVIKGIVPIKLDRDSLSWTESVSKMETFFIDQLTKLNERLEREAEDDKAIRTEVEKLPNPEPLLEGLERSRLIRFTKHRVRMGKKKPKKQRIQPKTARDLGKVFQNRGFKVRLEGTKGAPAKAPALEVHPEEREVVIREEHPNFVEAINVLGERFEVSYEEWEPTESLGSACRIVGKKVVFNSKHPVFQVALDVEIIKRLVAGTELIIRDQGDKSRMRERFYALYKEIL